MKKQQSILTDKRYAAFRARYHNNLVRYVAELSRKPMTWQQYDILKAVQPPGSRLAVASGHGCFGIGTEIMMADGSVRPVETISVGDQLMGDDCTSRNVLSLFRGRENLYRFEYMDGTSHVFNESHVLCLAATQNHGSQVSGEYCYPTVREWLGLGDSFKRTHAVLRRAFFSYNVQGICIHRVDGLGEGDYYGFALDGNHRFLGGDFTILHNSGKSHIVAWILDWHLRVYPKSNALITATNIEQVRSAVWKEMDTVIEDVTRTYPWMADWFVKETKRYYCNGFKDSWYVIPRTTSKAKPENLAGQHNDNYLCIVDEASGVEDEIHGVLRGALTHQDNRYAMFSQPTRSVGHFAEAFSTLSNVYTTMNLNAEESPIVSPKFIKEKLIEYGGHHSPEYQIKVLGRLPDNLSGFLIPKSWCIQAQSVEIEHTQPWGWVLTSDVAEGVHRDSSVWTLGKVSGYDAERRVEVVLMEETLDKDELNFARKIASELPKYARITVAVDADGPGRTVILTLEELGFAVERIHWGLPCHSRADQKRYKNQRAYASVKAREAIFEGRMRIAPGTKTVDQASRIPYKIDEAGRYAIMPKEQMKNQGIKSPDIFDTHCFFFLVDYIPADDVATDAERTQMESMMDWAVAAIDGDTG